MKTGLPQSNRNQNQFSDHAKNIFQKKLDLQKTARIDLVEKVAPTAAKAAPPRENHRDDRTRDDRVAIQNHETHLRVGNGQEETRDANNARPLRDIEREKVALCDQKEERQKSSTGKG